MIDQELALKLVTGKPWHHNFEVIPGVRTNGSYDPTIIWEELQLPADLTGISLADVGASNGYFSFEARKRGARVVAFDFRHKDNSGFGLAQYINGMHDIEHHQVNVLEIKQEVHGQFDVTLCLGLLYHTSDPYMALARCAAITRKQLLIESYCLDKIAPKALLQEPIMRFISDPTRFPQHGTVYNDPSNFWAFTSLCLQRMTEDLGFRVKRMNIRGDRVFIDAERVLVEEDKTRLNLAYGMMAQKPAGPDLNEPDKWVIF